MDGLHGIAVAAIAILQEKKSNWCSGIQGVISNANKLYIPIIKLWIYAIFFKIALFRSVFICVIILDSLVNPSI